MRNCKELAKIEESQTKLREELVQLASVEPAADMSAKWNYFTNVVAAEVNNCRQLARGYLNRDMADISGKNTPDREKGTD